MRKVLYNRFGDEQVLEVREQPTPTITLKQLLIHVKATSINPLDWKIYGGQMKLLSGSKFPKGVGIDFVGFVTGRIARLSLSADCETRSRALVEYLVLLRAANRHGALVPRYRW